MCNPMTHIMEESKNVAEEHLIIYLQNNYSQTSDYLAADARMTTHELFELLKSMFPVFDFTEDKLFTILVNLGYQYSDPGNFSPEWLFMNRKN